MFLPENLLWKRLKTSIVISVMFISLLWIVKLMEVSLGVRFTEFGILPKTMTGLKGVLFAPVIHGDFEHLASNSIPLLILGTILFNSYPKVAWRVVFLSYFIVGLLVWLTAQGLSFHIGASGIVYGLAFFLLASGLFRKDRKSIAITLVITLMYGGLIWGVIPLQAGISWESHLYGALMGVFAAFIYRNVDPPKQLVFDEDENDMGDDLPFFEWERQQAELRQQNIFRDKLPGRESENDDLKDVNG